MVGTIVTQAGVDGRYQRTKTTKELCRGNASCELKGLESAMRGISLEKILVFRLAALDADLP